VTVYKVPPALREMMVVKESPVQPVQQEHKVVKALQEQQH
jgi:hypothetical protein